MKLWIFIYSEPCGFLSFLIFIYEVWFFMMPTIRNLFWGSWARAIIICLSIKLLDYKNYYIFTNFKSRDFKLSFWCIIKLKDRPIELLEPVYPYQVLTFFCNCLLHVFIVSILGSLNTVYWFCWQVHGTVTCDWMFVDV